MYLFLAAACSHRLLGGIKGVKDRPIEMFHFEVMKTVSEVEQKRPLSSKSHHLPVCSSGWTHPNVAEMNYPTANNTDRI